MSSECHSGRISGLSGWTSEAVSLDWPRRGVIFDRKKNPNGSSTVFPDAECPFRVMAAISRCRANVRFTPDTVAKVENRKAPKISRMLTFSELYRCNAS
jgi:hypothetical protein